MSILNQFSLKNKVIVLTGGAGLYGRQLTYAVAETGAKLVIASRNLEKLKEIAATKPSLEISCESFDQGDEKSILDLRDRVMKQFGRVDGLVNNSVIRTMKTLEDP